MISKITLRNWKCHLSKELEFKPGINIIVGPMGAGKSSVLQAISFALFGSFAELKKKEIKITDILTRGSGAKDAEVELHLSEPELLIKRRIEEGKSSEATVRDKAGKLLAGPSPNQVSSFLKSQIKLDEDIFLRTSYAKQNEIDIFLQLTPLERKSRLDELMGLDKFESARKNCVKLTNQIKYKKETKENFLSGFDLDAIEKDVLSLQKECVQLGNRKGEVSDDLFHAEKEKNTLEQNLKSLRQTKEEYDRLEERKKFILSAIKNIEQKLMGVDLDKDLNVLMVRLGELKAQLEDKQGHKQNFEEELDRTLRASLEIEKKLGALEGKSSDLKDELNKIENLKQELRDLQAEGDISVLGIKLQEMEKQIENNMSQRQALISEIAILQKHLVQLEDAKGTCPVCSGQLAAETKEKLINERRQRIMQLDTDAQKALLELEKSKSASPRIKEIIEKQNFILQSIKPEPGLREQEISIARQLGEFKGKKQITDSSISRIKSKLFQLEQEIRKFDSEWKRLNEYKQYYGYRTEQANLKQELADLEQKLKIRKTSASDIQNTEQRFLALVKKIQSLSSEQESLVSILQEKERRFSDLKDKKEQIILIKAGIATLDSNIEFLNKFKNALLTTQESLRKELLLAVNEVMSSTWSCLYPYSNWDDIQLLGTESDYILQIKEAGGDWIQVAGFASGGERMLASLALRIAFAKVMASNLSLLILDEPTHNLDEKAIQTLIEAIQEKLSGFLDQIFIVTHEEKLAEAGENIIRI